MPRILPVTTRAKDAPPPVRYQLDDLAALDGDAEDRQLRLLYRDELRHAVGRNVAVHAHVRVGERHAYRLETT